MLFAFAVWYLPLLDGGQLCVGDKIRTVLRLTLTERPVQVIKDELCQDLSWWYLLTLSKLDANSLCPASRSRMLVFQCRASTLCHKDLTGKEPTPNSSLVWGRGLGGCEDLPDLSLSRSPVVFWTAKPGEWWLPSNVLSVLTSLQICHSSFSLLESQGPHFHKLLFYVSV